MHWPAELRRLSGAGVCTLDLPGHGRSGGLSCDTIRDYAEAVATFLRAVGIEQAVIVGHSMGGAIALTLGLDYADCVAGLVLVATGARLRVSPAILDGIDSDFEGAVELITQLAWSPEANPALTGKGRQMLLEAAPDVILGDFIACDRFDVMGRLGEVEKPTLVIGGTADRLTPLRYSHFMARSIPGAQQVTIEGAGHMVMLEEPVATAEAVRTFLESVFVS